jgi:uncharacterized protein (DUF2141 family)
LNVRIPHRRALGVLAACLAMSTSAAASAQDDADAIARAKRPERLRNLDVSGKGLALVAERIDPTQPLGTCTTSDTGARIRVILPNVRSDRGQVRVSLFGSDPGQWVRSKGGKLVRFDVTASRGRMEVCMPLPHGAGSYAVALYHDENGDNRYSLTSEGYGFSNNARSGLFGPPSHSQAVFKAGPALTDVEIRLRY